MHAAQAAANALLRTVQSELQPKASTCHRGRQDDPLDGVLAPRDAPQHILRAVDCRLDELCVRVALDLTEQVLASGWTCDPACRNGVERRKWSLVQQMRLTLHV